MTDATVAATLRAVLRHEMTPDRVRGGERGTNGRGADRERAGGAGPGRARPGWPATWWRAWWSPTSPSGPSGPGRRPPPSTPRTPASSSGPWWPSSAVTRPARACGSSTGGSVKAENAADLMAEPDVDGLLVGRGQPGGGQLHRHHSGHGRLLPFLGRSGGIAASWRITVLATSPGTWVYIVIEVLRRARA